MKKKSLLSGVKSLRSAFTLIEILIVVVLLGVVVAAAVPAVSQYRAAQAQAEMINDGQRLGTAAQAYFAETLERTVLLKYNPATGAVVGPDAFRMQDANRIAAGYIIPDNQIRITFDTKEAFRLKHAKGGTYTFSDRGDLVRSSE